MADITQHYRRLRMDLYTFGIGKEDLQALGNLPTKAELIAAFQSVEDNVIAAYPNWKADIDPALGITTTNALAKRLIAVVLEWKIEDLRT